jgi:stage II sporulation protein D
MSSQEFRETFGYDLIKSTRFSVVRAGDDFNFSGRGYGHGVGMCQFGARFMAMAGAKYTQILKRYYPKAKLPTAVLTQTTSAKAPTSDSTNVD